MKKAQIVSFHCILKDRIGNIISSTFNQDVITRLERSEEGVLPGLAAGLQDLKKGERRRIALSADQAFGFYDPKLVVEMPRRTFEKGRSLQVGNQIQTKVPTGDSRLFLVIEATAEQVTLDGNHPLAGQDLVFEIEATDARDASSEEIADSNGSGLSPFLH